MDNTSFIAREDCQHLCRQSLDAGSEASRVQKRGEAQVIGDPR
jgi:hypothetical protein